MLLPHRLHSHQWYHRTVSQLFAETCSAHADKPAILFEGQTLPFGELFDQVQDMAQGLLELGIDKGDVVSTLPSATPEFAVLYFATLQIGAVVNPLNLLWGTMELQGVLQRNQPKLIVAVDRQGPRDILALLEGALPDLAFEPETSCSSLPSLKQVVCVGRHGPVPPGYLDFNDLPRPADHTTLQQRRDQGLATDVQFMCQTSGTTSLSKSALWNHRPPLATAHFGARNLRITEQDRFICLAPFYHNSGLFALNMNLAYAGTTLVLMDGFDPAKALDLIERHQCTCTFGFDAHWQGLRRQPDFEKRQFTISKAILAGEPRTYDMVRDMCPAGATINNLYAQTENGPLVSLADHECVDEAVNKYTHGRPLPGVQVVIKHLDSGARVAQGEAGEICYKSPFLFQGYHQQPEEVDKAFDEEGYFHSGDYGHFDNGYLTYLGRLGGVVKSGGENVSTTRVTTDLLERFENLFDDVKTVGIDDAYWGTRVVSFVRTRDEQPLPPSPELREACKGHMAAYEIPKDFLPWDREWPMTPEGKIDFKQLQQRAREALGDSRGKR
ncbi:class I adenylate-forming enzyme family protein [Alloalcanivorax xenomutans]|uniref:class I adenylate-forming enzyme family protein n=1 Tax=Alloalcanivorax xenomutans TaxID=1094342 RepID=UPI0009B6ADE3|nr:class I adenylate-forming enzyme family protein [Alloalcanivorax xenomutans]ARB44783.1 hypothetical protein P40_04550 [Alloalcanivorax xenomutans]MCE7524262.1 acyl--CoA ligase [Alloalcanivorax xenomutans]